MASAARRDRQNLNAACTCLLDCAALADGCFPVYAFHCIVASRLYYTGLIALALFADYLHEASRGLSSMAGSFCSFYLRSTFFYLHGCTKHCTSTWSLYFYHGALYVCSFSYPGHCMCVLCLAVHLMHYAALSQFRPFACSLAVMASAFDSPWLL